MQHHYLLGIALGLGAVLAGCDNGGDLPPQQPPAPQVEEQDAQSPGVSEGADRAALQRPDVPPEETVVYFYETLRSGNEAEAGKMVARDTLTMSESQLEQDLAQMGDSITDREGQVVVLDSRQEGDFAIVATHHTGAENEPGNPELRPVVLIQEQGQWKIVYELLGMEPEQAFAMSPVAERVAPLYDWYSSRADELEREIVAQAPQ